MPQTTDNCGERSLNSIDWDEDWDENVNLWCQHKSGHTAQVHALKRVHAGPDSSSKLLLAAQLDQLSEVQPAKILAALRDMQTLDGGDLHGCLKWFFEESCPADTNAAFFTALGLIPLRSCYYDTLDAGSQRLLDTILADMRIWFGNQAEHRSFHYPNKFLGDLVCAWLLDELAGKSSSELVKVMHEAADYWRENHWGWGEHMSDCYSGVCLDELSLLLLLARNLPDDLHRKYQQLFDELLSIDDAFGSAPRVPAIRNYDFLKSPIRQTYRSKVVPQDPPPLAEVKNLPLLRPIFHG